MNLISSNVGRLVVQFDEQELLLIHNALNEVCNASDIADDPDEFHSRLGVTYEHAKDILASMKVMWRRIEDK